MRLAALVVSETGHALKEELIEFVTGECQSLKPSERLPGSTEILESSFGKWKSLEGENQRGGFTTLLLGYAALLGKTTWEVICAAITQTTTKLVTTWCHDHLGVTLCSKRNAAFQSVTRPTVAQQKSDEPIT
jgi:hypothetical protein